MKGKIKVVLIFLALAGLVVGYYYYLSNREVKEEPKKNTSEKEVNELIAKRLDVNYPGTPIEVLNMHLRITKAYYKSPLTEEQIEKLGAQARYLFDQELLEANPEEEHIKKLKEDIKNYNSKTRYVSDYTIERNSEIKYKTLAGKNYAMVDVLLYIREGSKLFPTPMQFTLRKDESGDWKILFWERNGEGTTESKKNE